MEAYVAGKGGMLTLQHGGRKLSDQELAAVAGGMTDPEVNTYTLATIRLVGTMVGRRGWLIGNRGAAV